MRDRYTMGNKHSSAELLLAIREGSIEAFNELYNRYVPLVMHITLHCVQDRMEAEEICHDIFLEVLRKSEQYDDSRGSLDAWIAVIARSRSMDYMRKKKRRAAVVSLEPLTIEDAKETTATPETITMGKLDRELLQEAIGELPLTQRNAIYAAYFQEKTQNEMATDWKVPLGTVKSWVRYGIGNLKKQLEKRGWHHLEERKDSYDQRS
ncbi:MULTISPECIES: RNA polymerase sigma factor [Paenibacillus]|uniref:RNA polymerase sigma factor n=1 Tax=Paenibacillus TaxID=44249 RepID=UPI00203F8048|nr:sigma-70 family RNA polymerase sigma factor [Paenibacillus camelliae]MCM3632488.1 sigma-70 family RNA polymerase sigma factor [Paenibacillus camelliae]